VLAHFSHHLMTALPVPALPFIRNEFNLNYTQATLVITAFSLSSGFSNLPAGWLADRIGPRILITIGICGVALAGVLVGLSQTFMMMLVFLVLMGLMAGGYHPAAAPLISSSVEPEKRGRALGLHMIGGSGSFFLAPIVAAAIAATWGWRGSFIGLAVPAMIFGIIFYIFLGRYARTSQAQPEATEHHDGTSLGTGRLRNTVIFLILSVFVAGVIHSVVAVIPLYMIDHFGVSEQMGASLLAIVYAAGFFGGPLGGYICDRLGRVPVLVVTSLIAGLVIYLLNLAPYGLGIGALLMGIGMAMFIRIPVSEAYLMSRVPKHRRSTVYGIFYFSSQESGAVLAPVMGYLIDHFGFYTSFTAASIATVAVTLICGVLLWGSRD